MKTKSKSAPMPGKPTKHISPKHISHGKAITTIAPKRGKKNGGGLLDSDGGNM